MQGFKEWCNKCKAEKGLHNNCPTTKPMKKKKGGEMKRILELYFADTPSGFDVLTTDAIDNLADYLEKLLILKVTRRQRCATCEMPMKLMQFDKKKMWGCQNPYCYRPTYEPNK